MSDTFNRLKEVFLDVFDDDEIELSRDTTAADVDAWDSLMHVTLVLAIEREFGRKTITTGRPMRSSPVTLAIRVMPISAISGHTLAKVSDGAMVR